MSETLAIQCSGCHSKLKVANKHLGKKIACPKCQEAILVSAPKLAVPVAAVAKPAPSISATPSVRPLKPDAKPTVPVPIATVKNSMAAQTAKPIVPKPKQKPKPKPVSPPVDDEIVELDDVLEDDDDIVEVRKPLRAFPPRMKKAKPPKKPKVYSDRPRRESGALGGTSSNVLKGILMMIGAVVWFIGGLAAGYIFFYPPILFIIGLGTLIKGMNDG